MHELTHGLDRGRTISEPVARPIATNVTMDRTSLCNHEHDRKRVSQLDRDEFFAHKYADRELANDPVECDEGRTKTFVDCNDDCERVPRLRRISQASTFGRNESCDGLSHVRSQRGLR